MPLPFIREVRRACPPFSDRALMFFYYDSGARWANLLCKTETGSPVEFCPSPYAARGRCEMPLQGFDNVVLYVIHACWGAFCVSTKGDRYSMFWMALMRYTQQRIPIVFTIKCCLQYSVLWCCLAAIVVIHFRFVNNVNIEEKIIYLGHKILPGDWQEATY